MVFPVMSHDYEPLGTKINSSDPPLTAISTAHATPPFLPFFTRQSR
jgi:hypothetical protein